MKDWIDGLIAEPNEERVLAATATNGSFDPAFPGLQTAIDSTSLGEAKQCSMKYFLAIICGLEKPGGSPHLEFGIFMHAASEAYHHARVIGMEHDDALDATLEETLRVTWDEKLGRPWASGHPTKNRKSLIQTIVWYFDQFKDDPLQTIVLENGKPAVEVSFRFDTGYRANGAVISACGHFDRMAMLGDELVIPDVKTTESALDQRWFDKWTPGNQFSMYALAGRVVYGLPVNKIVVDGIQVGAGFARFRRQAVPRTEAYVMEWHAHLGRWIGRMAEDAGRMNWPQNDKACDLYGGCQFRELCSRSPVAREAWAKANYRRRIWDPTQARGDV